jgi:Zn-dependent M32 family carboxypeptidase
MNKYCDLCEDIATRYDSDMDMYLCISDYNAFNGIIEDIELNEVYDA